MGGGGEGNRLVYNTVGNIVLTLRPTTRGGLALTISIVTNNHRSHAANTDRIYNHTNMREAMCVLKVAFQFKRNEAFDKFGCTLACYIDDLLGFSNLVGHSV